MTSPRKRNYLEKQQFQEELKELWNPDDDPISHIDIDEYDDDDTDRYLKSEREAQLLDDWYDAYDDDAYYDDSYYDDNDHYVESSYEHYDWIYDDDIPYPNYNPGNHLRDNRTDIVYLVTEDYRLIDILTGKYTNIHLINDVEVIL
jgi:hypothetical protein